MQTFSNNTNLRLIMRNLNGNEIDWVSRENNVPRWRNEVFMLWAAEPVWFKGNCAIWYRTINVRWHCWMDRLLLLLLLPLLLLLLLLLCFHNIMTLVRWLCMCALFPPKYRRCRCTCIKAGKPSIAKLSYSFPPRELTTQACAPLLLLCFYPSILWYMYHIHIGTTVWHVYIRMSL